jgi:hypothetical protein
MALIVADRVAETSTTTGTGALTLAAAITGFRRFSAVCSTNDTAYYAIIAVDGNGNPSGDWECGLGTYSSANTLTRTTPQASTNSNAAVNFGAGTKYVYLSSTAAHLATLLPPSAAVASDLNTGTNTTKFVTPDALAGANLGTPTITLLVSDPNGSAITTGDGKAYWRVPSTLNGMNLVGVAAHVTTVSSSGIPTIQIANVTDSVDMLSTKLTIDASEKDSSTAATAAVIDTAHDDVATGDELRIDIDVAGTGAKGLMVEMQFQLP